MNPEYHTYELIDRYLNKQLSVEEHAQFDLKLSQDKEFASLVEAQKIANELIIDEQMLRLKERMQKDLGGNEGNTFNWKTPVLLSGALLFSLAGYYFYSQNETPSLQEDAIKPSGAIGTSSKKSFEETKSITDKQSETPERTKNTKYKKYPELRAQETTNQEAISDFINTVPDEEKKPVENNTAVTNNTTKEENQEKEIKPSICNDIKITGRANSVNSCAGKTDGTITIDLNSIKGGTAPYLFSIKENNFSTRTHFENLEKGIYHVLIKDRNNCISTWEKSVVIEEKTCHELIDDAFMPSNGETWKFPLKENTEAAIKIISKAGIVVYSAKISGGYPSEWDGRGTSGADLNAGMYHFIIEYGNGQQQQGYISIVK